MDPPHEIKYIDDRSILLINTTGNLRQLFVPFMVQCIKPAGNIKPETWVYVEEVGQHHQLRIVYKVFNDWLPYSCFRIIIYY